jgi:signal peptidase II
MRASHVAIGLILAGGIGNLYDRIIYGAVRDFLHMLPGWSLPNGWRWPGTATGDVFPWVFNVADVMLLCGMGIFIVTSFMEDRRARRLELEARGSSA